MGLGFENPLQAPDRAAKVLTLNRTELLRHLEGVHCEGKIGQAVFEKDWSAVERTADGALFVSAPSCAAKAFPRRITVASLSAFIDAAEAREGERVEITVTNDTLELDQTSRIPISGGSPSVRSLHEAKAFGNLGPWTQVEPAWVAELRAKLERIIQMNPSRGDGPRSRVVVPLGTGQWSYVPLKYEPRMSVDFESGEGEYWYEVEDMPDLPPKLTPQWEDATGPRRSPAGGGMWAFQAPVPEVADRVKLPVDVLSDVCKTVLKVAEGGEIEISAEDDMLAFRTRGFTYAMPLGGLREDLR